jgi:predicted PurR-regulated permease PerM
MPPIPQPRVDKPAGRPIWAALAFLVAFLLGVVALAYYYLLPALRAFLEARRHGDKPGTQAISATSALLLAVVLLILVAGMLLTFRIGRLFFPRNPPPRTRTEYVDAWAESAKRMETPPEE